MTDTKQTMREHLRQHGLPEAWAEWVREMATEYTRESMTTIVEIRGPGVWCKLDIKDGEPPWWMRDKVPGFEAAHTFEHKDPDADWWRLAEGRRRAEVEELRAQLRSVRGELDEATAKLEQVRKAAG